MKAMKHLDGSSLNGRVLEVKPSVPRKKITFIPKETAKIEQSLQDALLKMSKSKNIQLVEDYTKPLVPAKYFAETDSALNKEKAKSTQKVVRKLPSNWRK